ncbi:MAG: type II toxin-antitoxin system VapC family toxin [Deltaproteobacteria bacterium]|nr:type II toxin-antitoxin system VapC family toxin [Deltaproteobacteria bacterium]MBK7069690.1 type II toxin-antitoxin system VapC family toxin [Deltaproteobacteria bacterium]MBK8692549.1 type II toxin-antitoxin system VapC family toxin [Deltaproteobacteria bacterium]MBP9105184.1 type II toxin-antitoxin system VapC family toxin [Gemmatimonadaceae bacterium]
MTFLIDTHVLLWWRLTPDRLRPESRALLADRGNTVLWSAATAWEISIKTGISKLDVGIPIGEFCVSTTRLGFDWLPITAEHCAAMVELPRLHGDPFDRMLVAQATVEGIPLMSDDPQVVRYPIRVV